MSHLGKMRAQYEILSYVKGKFPNESDDATHELLDSAHENERLP